MTTSLIDQPLTKIGKHPLNPRHDEVADDELVGSVKSLGILEPVLLGPADDKGKRLLLAGHRRVDAARKAGLKTVPALCRDDLATEGQQLEVMLVENCRRENLTPMEEAEGFHQLALFGYKHKDIARISGLSTKTVSARLKLIKLAKSTQDRVHKGQLTIDDALAIAEFADDKATTKTLEDAAARGGTALQYAVEHARDKKKHAAEQATLVAELEARGATRVDAKDLYADGRTTLWQTGAGKPEEHDDCLVYAVSEPTFYTVGVNYSCADPARHKATMTDQQKEREAAAAESRERYAQEQAKRAAGARVRAKVLVDAVGLSGTLTPGLRDVIRGLLPIIVASIWDHEDAYMDLAGVAEEDRWKNLHQPAEVTKFAGHVEDIDRVSDNVLVRHLVTALALCAQTEVENNDLAPMQRRYFALLEGLGYELTDDDREVLDRADETTAEAS